MANGIHAAGGYGPPGGGGYGGPPQGGGGGGYPPPGGGGYGGPPQGGGGAPPGGFGGGPPPGGGGYGGPPQGGGFGPPQGGGYGGGGFGPPGGFPPPGGPMMPGAGGEINTTLPLILNIVSALFCGGACVSFILAVLGIVFAVQAGSAKNMGDFETARAKAKTSMTMAIVSAVIGFLGIIAYTLLSVLSR